MRKTISGPKQKEVFKSMFCSFLKMATQDVPDAKADCGNNFSF